MRFFHSLTVIALAWVTAAVAMPTVELDSVANDSVANYGGGSNGGGSNGGVSPSTSPPGHSGPWPPRVCNPNASGSNLAAQQYAALNDFVYMLYVKRTVRAAYDRWVPNQYIQHNPFAEPGREFAINFLADSFANPSTTATKIKFFAGQGYGMAHFKLTLPTITFAVVDYFRFKGTCIVEHWDVLQEITGTEPNPIAFF